MEKRQTYAEKYANIFLNESGKIDELMNQNEELLQKVRVGDEGKISVDETCYLFKDASVLVIDLEQKKFEDKAFPLIPHESVLSASLEKDNSITVTIKPNENNTLSLSVDKNGSSILYSIDKNGNKNVKELSSTETISFCAEYNLSHATMIDVMYSKKNSITNFLSDKILDFVESFPIPRKKNPKIK